MKNVALWACMFFCFVVLIYVTVGRGMLPHDERQEACEQSPEICELIRPKK